MLRAAVLALVSSLVTHVAGAQDAETRARARSEFELGEAAYARAEYAEALARFERAMELAPHDAVRFNLALCHEQLGRMEDALQQYEIAAVSDDLDDETRARARSLAEDARGRIRPEREAEPAQRPVPTSMAGTPPATSLTPGSEARADDTGRGLSWLFALGASVAAVGVGGIVGFGTWASDVHGRCNPYCVDSATRSDGLLARDLTNVSIGVAVLGGVLALVDILLAALSTGEDRRGELALLFR